jgi:serine/threonine-protein kinase
MTGSGAVFGTPHYVSPEQAESSREATPRSDLWSVAVVAYECLTGRRPFPGDNLMTLCIALHEVRYARATKVCPGLPAAVDAWFERAFQHEPDERFASAGEMARALEDVLARANPITTPLDDSAPATVNTRASWSSTMRRPRNAHRPSAWAWGLAAAGAMATAVLFVERLVSAPPATPDHATATSSVAPAQEPTARPIASVPSPEPAASATAPTAAPRPAATARPVRPLLPAPRPSATPTPNHELFTDQKN